MTFFDTPKDNRTSVSLKDTEKSLLDAASRILSARITAGQISDAATIDDMKSAVITAIKMAKMIDRMVQADNEL
ncbi:hypothetical protein [Marinobacter sp. SS5-14b]|uniref:hypothetical protein n=1 Tax=Marinobacter sp. SS5-14b TaxID=3050456 RepID=UPI0026E0B618|nr:hypothetical protein [Marinobacter sp. SS5-14b]